MEEDKLKCKEQWLREELRAARTLLTSWMQWGITVLAAIWINIYYIRRDAGAHLVEQKIINANEPLPLTRWLIGTFGLFVIAFVFAVVTNRAAGHHRAYRNLLVTLKGGYSGIEESIPVGNKLLNRSPWILFFSIPLMDFVAWFLFSASIKGSIPFQW